MSSPKKTPQTLLSGNDTRHPAGGELERLRTACAELEATVQRQAVLNEHLRVNNERLQAQAALAEARERPGPIPSQAMEDSSDLFQLQEQCRAQGRLLNELLFTPPLIGRRLFKNAPFSWLTHLQRRLAGAIQRHIAAQIPFRLGICDQYPPRPVTYDRLPRPRDQTAPPRICIITPSYQQASYLEQTMLSVLDQGYPNLAYGVQDGGSTDGSAEIIVRHLGRLTHAESARDKGQSDAIHKGFVKLYPERNDIMAWLNSDDLLAPGTLWYVADYFQRHPEVDVLYGHRIVIDENGAEIGRWFLPHYHENTLKWFDLVPQETVFWRTKCYQDVLGVDPTFQFALDWDLLLRFEQAGYRIARVPYFLGCFRSHSQQKTSAKIKTVGEEEMMRLRIRIHGRPLQSWEIIRHLIPEEQASNLVAWLWTRGIRW